MDSSSFAAMLMVGGGVLVQAIVLPFAVCIGLGLLALGISQGRWGLLVFGAALPLGLWIMSSIAIDFGAQNPLLPATFVDSFDFLRSLSIYAWIGAGIVFLIRIVPGVLKS